MKMPVFILLIPLLLSPITLIANEWISYGADPLGNKLYYDKKISASKDIVKVATKTVYTAEGKADYINMGKKLNLRTEGYENLSHTVNLLRVNCKAGEYKISSVTDYDKYGKVLISEILENSSWRPIVVDSPAHDLHKAVCKGSDNKRVNDRSI